MGNSKSKNTLNAGHEKLNEHDEKYFHKVYARNSTSRPSRRFRKPRPVLAMKACATAFTSIEPPREDDDDSLVWSYENKSPKALNAKPNLGPLPLKMKIADDVSVSSSFSRANLKLRPIDEGSVSPHSALLPSPREETFVARQSTHHRNPAQRRLEKARANQIRPADSFTDLSITSSLSSTTSSTVIQDYYTEMLEEAHRESREADAEAKSDISRAFDSMFPTGMVWAEVTRGGRVTCLAFSRSNMRDEAKDQPLLMAVGTEDGTLAVMEIMDMHTSPLNNKQFDSANNRSKRIGTVKELPREGQVRSLDFSPDGCWLVVGGDDCTATLMRVTFRAFPGLGKALSSVEAVQEFEREDRVYCVQFSPDASKLAVGGYDGMVTIALVENVDQNAPEMPVVSQPVTLLTEISRPGLVLCLDWSPDGSAIAVGGSEKSCTLIDDSWQVVGEIQRSSSVSSVKWDPSGATIAIGCDDGTVTVVDVETQTVTYEIAGGVARKVSQNEDDTRSASSHSQTGGHMKVNSLCWSPDGQFLAIGSSDHCCAIFETKSFVLVHENRRSGAITCLVWSQRRLLTGEEGRYLVIGSEDRSVAILKTGVANESDDTVSVAASDDSNASSYFSIGSLSQHQWILREDSFRDIEDDISFSPTIAPSFSLDGGRADGLITAVSFSRHKKGALSIYMTTANSNGCVTITSTADWRTVQQYMFSQAINSVHFSRRSNLMALGGQDGTVHIVSVSDWRIIKEIQVSSAIHAVKFSRSDERLAVGCSDGMLTLLNPANGWKVAGEIDTSDSSVSSVDWSSRHVAVGRSDGTVAVYEAARVYANFFLPEAELSCGDARVYSVAFGVGGQFLAVGDANGKIGVYSQKGGWVLCHKINTSTSGAVVATKWSSDGRYFAFGGKHQDLGAKVVDTLAWTNVKELHKLDPGEQLSTLEWSNDDKWLVLACSNGSSYVINTTDWQVNTSFPSLGNNATRIAQTTSESPPAAVPTDDSSGGSDAKTEYSDMLNGDVLWHESPRVVRFLALSEAFVDAHPETDPTPALLPLLKCVLMLTIHVKWVTSKDSDTIKRITRVDDGEPAIALIRLLGKCTDVMKQAMRGDHLVDSSAGRFQLKQRDLRRIQAWNEQWLAIDAKTSRVDISLLQAADEAN